VEKNVEKLKKGEKSWREGAEKEPQNCQEIQAGTPLTKRERVW